MEQGASNICSIHSLGPPPSHIFLYPCLFSLWVLSHDGRCPLAVVGTPSTAGYPGDGKQVHLPK